MDYEQLVELFGLAYFNQEALNQKLHPDWRSQNYPFWRAGWTEAAEAINHLKWEWWKHHDYREVENRIDPNTRTQILLELVDILHFGLSIDLQRSSPDFCASSISRIAARGLHEHKDYSGSLMEAIEKLAFYILDDQDVDVDAFGQCCGALKATPEAVLGMYFAKAALNEFRWANGYKDGTYCKQWLADRYDSPREDNLFLADAVNDVLAVGGFSVERVRSGQYKQDVMDQLTYYYRESQILAEALPAL